MIETPQESEPKPDTDVDASRPGRMLRRSMIVVGIVIALGLLISFAPMFAVRYYANSILNDLGIDHTGIDTLSINPWTRELRIGPARFGTGKADPAQIGELGLRLSYNPLLKRQVLVEQISLLDIDLYIQRLEDGSFVLNGIPMSHLLPAPEGGGQPEKQDSLWGAGLKTLELRDSRLVFQDGERGDLKVDVERLTLSDFQTWRPDSPGHFALAATVNDTVLNWSGELRPFAHNIVLDIDSRTEQAELPKVIRFTGPLGLDRQDGTYDVELEYHMTLFDSGRIEGESRGTIAIKDLDYLRQGEFSLKLERATVELDLSFTWSEANDFNLSGELTSSLGPHNVTFGADTQAGASKGRVTLSALDISHAANGALGIELQPDIDLEKVSFSGPIEISLDSLIEVLAMLQSLSANAALMAADTGLSDLAESSVSIPSSDVSVDHLQIIGESMSLQSAAGQVALELDTRTSLSGMQIDVNERRVRITQLQGRLRPLRLQTGDDGRGTA